MPLENPTIQMGYSRIVMKAGALTMVTEKVMSESYRKVARDGTRLSTSFDTTLVDLFRIEADW
jgi:hypothetical protein